MAVNKLSRRARYATASTPGGGHSNPRLTRAAGVDTFDLQGVLAERDEWGVERFNFPQQIWLYPNIAMGSHGTAPREVLAINILTRLIHGRAIRVLVGTTSHRVLQLVPMFMEECLSGSQAHWSRYTIPIAALRAWVALKR